MENLAVYLGRRWCGVLIFACCLGLSGTLWADGDIDVDAGRRMAMLSDGHGHLALRINYHGRCMIDQVVVRGRQIAADAGVASGICIGGEWFTTRSGIPAPSVAVRGNRLIISNIIFGPAGKEIRETWRFTVQDDGIVWRIEREYPTAFTADDAAFPEWNFGDMSTWTGGLLDNGGVVWTKYLETTNATYGAHAGAVTFWNRDRGDGLRITPKIDSGLVGTTRFSHQPNNSFSFDYAVSDSDRKTKHDLCRYLPDRQDLWAPFAVPTGQVAAEFTLQALDYNQVCNRGTFRGLAGASIRELLNTVSRYGVIDRHLVGGNGWRSGYICLHEQWFAEIGAALGDADYIANYSQALDYARDHAINSDGRVKGRWCYNAGDAMPGTYDDRGFYEAQWGYLLDSQPDYVINVSEQFDLTGDRLWLAGQKVACERALEFLLRREVGHSGLVAMMTDSLKEQRGSDWIDIIWASYENALVNAELYYALELWAGAEDALGDAIHAARYREFAGRLKASFNRPISEGGFWNPTNQWYVYWREKDGGVHGDNLVIPVNFAAIAYGLCDEPSRSKAILDEIEAGMVKEDLFAWPLNFVPYQRDEGAGSNFPFPRYENGDIFLSWGEVAIRAYAAYDPALALKYIKKNLARYEQDGLSFQRYLRKNQVGAGDDILAGNCMPIVGLYRDIYGIQPRPNRLYLEPHLTSELNGTELRYPLRGQLYVVGLETGNYSVTAGPLTIRDRHPFGVNAAGSQVEYFPGTNSDWSLSVERANARPLIIQIEDWPADPAAPRSWTESSSVAKGTVRHQFAHLQPATAYDVIANGRVISHLRTDKIGRAEFNCRRGLVTPQKFELRLSEP